MPEYAVYFDNGNIEQVCAEELGQAIKKAQKQSRQYGGPFPILKVWSIEVLRNLKVPAPSCWPAWSGRAAAVTPAPPQL